MTVESKFKSEDLTPEDRNSIFQEIKGVCEPCKCPNMASVIGFPDNEDADA